MCFSTDGVFKTGLKAIQAEQVAELNFKERPGVYVLFAFFLCKGV